MAALASEKDPFLGSEDARIKHVCEAINRDPLLDAGELAKMTKLSRSRLDELFKDFIGVSLGDYSRRKRIELAALLLRTTMASVKEIAVAIGYAHTSSFTRAFKSAIRTSPSDYRIGRSRQMLTNRDIC